MIERRDVKAIQNDKGAYRPDGRYVQRDGKWECEEYFPWKGTDILDHITGNKTYGHYLVSPEGNCRVFCFDIDIKATGKLRTWDENAVGGWVYGEELELRKIWQSKSDRVAHDELALQLRCMAEGLALRTHRVLDVPVAVSYSGNKGMHVYGLTGTMNASDCRLLAVDVLKGFECFEPVRGDAFWQHKEAYGALEIEVFPKQDEIAKDGFGNLIRLPLGTHRKSDQAGYFVDMSTGYGEPWKMDDPMLALTVGSIR